MIGYRGRSGGWFGKVKWLVAAMIRLAEIVKQILYHHADYQLTVPLRH